jgi:hypothetical protein
MSFNDIEQGLGSPNTSHITLPIAQQQSTSGNIAMAAFMPSFYT